MLEATIALVLGLTVLTIVHQLTMSGSRLFTRGLQAARGPEAALLLMDRFEEDVLQMVQVPGDPRPPARVVDGHILTFYRAEAGLSTPARVVGIPGYWNQEPLADDPDLYNPIRDGVRMTDIEFGGFTFELLPPDAEEKRLGWYLAVEARFPTGARGADHVVRRLIYLPQPSSNFLHFLSHGDRVIPGAVQLLAANPSGRVYDAFDRPGAR